MRKKISAFLILFFITVSGFSQTQYGPIRYVENGNTINEGRAVSQRTDHANLDTLSWVLNGTTAYDTINQVLVVYDGTSWVDIGSGGGGGDWTKTGGVIHPTNLPDSVSIGSSTDKNALFNVDGTAQMKSGTDRTLFVGEYVTKLGTNDLKVNGSGYEYVIADTVMQAFAGGLELDMGGGYLPLANTLTNQVWIDGVDNINRMSLSTTNGTQLYSGSLFGTSPMASLDLNPVMGQGYTASVEGSKRNFRWADLTNVIDPIYYTLSDAGLKLTSKEFYVKNATSGNNVIKSIYDVGVGGVYLTVESEQMDINTLTSALSIFSARNADLTASRTLTLKSSADAVNVLSLTGINFQGAYTFPMSDGTAGQALTTDGAGQLAWKKPVQNVRATTTTVANTTTETEIFTYDIDANSLAERSIISLYMTGVYSNSAANEDFKIRYKLNGVTIHELTRAGGNVSAIGWRASWSASIRTLGAAATLSDYAEYLDNEGIQAIEALATHTFNSTATTTLSATIQWDTANVGNTFSITQGILKIE